MRRAAATVLGVVVVLFAGLTAGVVLGMVDVTPPLVDDSSAETTATPQADLRTDGAGDGPGTSSDDHGYAMSVDRIESCGPTCRDVTATITNTGDGPRENVSVVTRVSTGGEQVWSGSQDVGTLAPSESHTTTERVELGSLDGLRVERNDGYVTVETTVRSDSGTTTFAERRRVG
ncbi:hypothetical protein [Halomarina oriensis]|uniref:Uncharacterized protein n=1 Tax=Halomarina oriensis TaxID=671145 RepID=A0A6B0GH96_9EURY|nr:hypothetical protein [Halomarina oriensis]MWG33960.1 hypothetical protein [Halomarina oriensis]